MKHPLEDVILRMKTENDALHTRIAKLEDIIERLVPEGELENDAFEQAEHVDALEQAARAAAEGGG